MQPGKKYLTFKAKHPKLHVANAFISMFLPACLTALALLIFKVVDGRAVLVVYAVVGSFILGGGLTLCVATNYDKEVFWGLNFYPIAIGALIALANIFYACNKTLGIDFDENLLMFQLSCYLSAFLYILFYCISREAMTDHISSKTHLNKSQLDKRKEGLFNYLWYHEIHKEKGIGWVYYFNIIFTAMLLLLLIGTSILAFSRSIANVVMPLSLIMALLAIILDLFVLVMAVKNKKSYYKTNKKRLLGKIPYFFEIAGIVIVLLFVWLQIRSFIVL